MGRYCLWHKKTQVMGEKKECTYKQNVELIDYNGTVDFHYNGYRHSIVTNPTIGFVWSKYISNARRFSFNGPGYSKL